MPFSRVVRSSSAFRKAQAASALRLRPWTPREIQSSLVAWYDSDARASTLMNGSTVSQWSDISGNGRHMVQPVAANQPSLANTLNGKRLVSFDGVNDALLSDPVSFSWPGPLAAPYAVFMVMIPPAYAGFTDGRRAWSSFNGNHASAQDSSYVIDYWAYAGVGNPAAVIGYTGPSMTYFGGAYDVYSTVGVPKHPSGGLLSASVILPGDVYRRWFGTVVDRKTTLGADASLFGMCLGADGQNGSPTLHSSVSFGECIVYSGAENVAMYQRIEGYLAWKWGLQSGLAAGHPFLAGPPRL